MVLAAAGALVLCGAGEPEALEVTAPLAATTVGATGSLLVSWRARTVPGCTVLVRGSVDGGTAWKDLGFRPAETGIFLWENRELPEETPLRVRLLLKDPQGAVLKELEAPGIFRVDRTAPTARVVGPETAEKADVDVTVEASDGKGSGISTVFLWSCEEGRPWSLAAESGDPTRPIPWTAPHRGRWFLSATASDKAGNVAPPPSVEPQLRIWVHTPEPYIARFSVETGDYVVPGGYALPLSWAVEADPGQEIAVTIEAKGEKGAWEPVGVKLPAQGRMTWKLPSRSGAVPLLRLRASTGRYESPKEIAPWILVDADPPQAALEGPKVWTKRSPVELDARVQDTLAGVARLVLWARDPETGIWRVVQSVPASRPLTFEEAGGKPYEDGRYALWLSASDTLGNASRDPVPGDTPMLELLLDRTPPEVSLLKPMGGEILDAGVPLAIAWSATDANLPAGTVALFASRDAGASWELLKDSLPGDGEFRWATPREPGPLWIRVTALDAVGSRGEAVLGKPVALQAVAVPPPPPVVVQAPPSPPPPPVVVMEPAPEPPVLGGFSSAVQGGRPLTLSWRPPSAKGFTVRIESSGDGGRSWERVGESSAAEGRMVWEVPALDRVMRLRLSLLKGGKALAISESTSFTVASRPPRLSLVAPAPAPGP